MSSFRTTGKKCQQIKTNSLLITPATGPPALVRLVIPQNNSWNSQNSDGLPLPSQRDLHIHTFGVLVAVVAVMGVYDFVRTVEVSHRVHVFIVNAVFTGAERLRAELPRRGVILSRFRYTYCPPNPRKSRCSRTAESAGTLTLPSNRHRYG